MNALLRERLDSVVGGALARQLREKRDRALLDGLGATRVKVLQHKGTVLYSDPLDDHATRATFVRMAYELDDAFPNRIGVELEGQLRLTSDGELLGILAGLGVASIGDPSAEGVCTGLALAPATANAAKPSVPAAEGAEIRPVTALASPGARVRRGGKGKTAGGDR